MTSYAVIGVGGVGGFYGINLAHAGAEVHFLLRSAPAGADTLTLESAEGTVVVRDGIDCRIHRDWSDIPAVDIALVAVKAIANPDVAPRIGAIVKPGGAVVLLQNGIDAEPGYAAALPADVDVIGGLAFLASHRASPTSFVHVDYGALTLGRYRPGYQPGGVSPAMSVLAGDLAAASVPVIPSEDLLAARWQKLVWNIPFNGLSVVLDARTDALMSDSAAVSVITALMGEVVAAAAADGRAMEPDLIDGLLDGTRAMRSYAPSMQLDYAHRRPLEIAAMYRAPLTRAARVGVDMVRTGMLADALTFLDARNRAAG
jgi:2-dehydropantoate 2-reductase